MIPSTEETGLRVNMSGRQGHQAPSEQQVRVYRTRTGIPQDDEHWLGE